MARRIYAKRCSQAIFEIALERKELDRWQSDLLTIAELTGDADLVSFLNNPRVRFDEKVGLLSRQLEDINPLALNLVRLLITRGRLDIVSDIAGEYQNLLDNHRGIERAEIVTVIPLEEADKQKLAETLGTIVGKKVIPESVVDPSLIGGVIVRVGGKLLDGSTRSKLAALKKELVGLERKR